MSNSTTGPDSGSANLIDHVTDFRLSLAGAQDPNGLDATWWSVLVELADTSIDKFKKKLAQYTDDLLIPVAYDPDDRKRKLSRQPLVIFARKRLIIELNRLDNPYHVVSIRLGATTPERFLDPSATFPPMEPIVVDDATTVVMAVVDDGIAIAHDLFRNTPLSTRICHATILEAESEKGSHASVGRALDHHDINRLLKRCSFASLLDEDLFYRLSGQVDLAQEVFSTVALRTSHGTHVAALAAGHFFKPECENRPIICAALPSRLVEDTTGIDLLPSLYLAFHILVKQASRFRICTKKKDTKPAPVVFNFSYGNTGGPHDGTGLFATLFEHYFGLQSEISDGTQKAWLTLPAGNSNLARLHAVDEGRKEQNDLKLDLTVLPDDRTPTQVQIWMPHSPRDYQPDFATLCVTLPFGDESGTIHTQPGERWQLYDEVGREIACLAYQYVDGSTKRGLVTLSINPTGDLKPGGALAPAGDWRIEIARNAEAPREPIHAWIRRDETLPGTRSGGRQAYFSNPGYQRFGPYGAPLPVDPPDSDCPIRRSGTISGFSCGSSPIVVAAYTERDAELSLYSAAGPLDPCSALHDPPRIGPDLTAKGDESYVQRGVLSAGSRCGTWVRLSGTSVAAPRVAHAAADHIGDYPGDGRAWSQQAPSIYPFDLQGDAKETRAGAGGVAIKIWPGSCQRNQG